MLQQIHFRATGKQSLPQEAAVGKPAAPTAFLPLFPPPDKPDAFEFEASRETAAAGAHYHHLWKAEKSGSIVHCWMDL